MFIGKSSLINLVTLLVFTMNANASSSDIAACKSAITVSFAEGAPVDRFEIKNNSNSWQIVNLEIDLSTSRGKLIFDTISGGKGVEVFQPYKAVSGDAKILKANTIKDGSDLISLAFEQFKSGQNYTFSIDVDDQLTASQLGQIRVTGSEMELATVNFMLANSSGVKTNAQAVFNANNQAILADADCSS